MSSSESPDSSEALRRSWRRPTFTKLAVGAEAGLGGGDVGQAASPPAGDDSAMIRKSGRATEHVYPYLRTW